MAEIPVDYWADLAFYRRAVLRPSSGRKAERTYEGLCTRRT